MAQDETTRMRLYNAIWRVKARLAQATTAAPLLPVRTMQEHGLSDPQVAAKDLCLHYRTLARAYDEAAESMAFIRDDPRRPDLDLRLIVPQFAQEPPLGSPVAVVSCRIGITEVWSIDVIGHRLARENGAVGWSIHHSQDPPTIVGSWPQARDRGRALGLARLGEMILAGGPGTGEYDAARRREGRDD